MNQRDIAVRMFTNETYGKTYAKGKFKKAIFNATAELRNPSIKYLLDFYRYDDWVNRAKSDLEMRIVTNVCASGIYNDPDTLLTFVQLYDPLTKGKTHVPGIGILNLSSGTLELCIEDLISLIDEHWTLDVATCKAPGPGKPTLLAANIDVGSW